jgi:hypothetical protein
MSDDVVEIRAICPLCHKPLNLIAPNTVDYNGGIVHSKCAADVLARSGNQQLVYLDLKLVHAAFRRPLIDDLPGQTCPQPKRGSDPHASRLDAEGAPEKRFASGGNVTGLGIVTERGGVGQGRRR